MWLLSRPRPVLASFIGAAIAVLPAYFFAGPRITAFIYIFVMPLCFVVGQFLMAVGLLRLQRFMLGAIGTILLLSMVVSFGPSYAHQFDPSVVLNSVLGLAIILGMGGIPGALIWWVLAVRPYNSQIGNDAFDAGQPDR